MPPQDANPTPSFGGFGLKEITLVPRPVTRPVEVWQPIVSSTPRGMDFMAKHGIKGIVTWSDRIGEDRLVKYRDANAAWGRDLRLGEGICVSFSVHLDGSREKALRSAQPYFEENMKIFAPLRMVRGSVRRSDPVTVRAPGGIHPRSSHHRCCGPGPRLAVWQPR